MLISTKKADMSAGGDMSMSARAPPKAPPISKFCSITEKSGYFGDIWGGGGATQVWGADPKNLFAAFGGPPKFKPVLMSDYITFNNTNTLQADRHGTVVNFRL